MNKRITLTLVLIMNLAWGSCADLGHVWGAHMELCRQATDHQRTGSDDQRQCPGGLPMEEIL